MAKPASPDSCVAFKLPSDPRWIDLTGKRFGSLSVIAFAEKGADRHSRWRCQCDCGAPETIVTGQALRGSRSVSCGCFRVSASKAANTTHGGTANGLRTAEYRVWVHIRQRCENPTDAAFPRYGGRGLVVCDRWRDGEDGISAFACFLADMGPKPSPRHSIERKDNSLGYSKGNCEWSTDYYQSRNKRNNVWIVWRDETMILEDALNRSGASRRFFKQHRRELGLTSQEAFDLVLLERRVTRYCPE